MIQYSKKAQVLLTDDQFEVLEKAAEREDKKIGTLIREAVEIVYLKKERRKRVQEAVRQVLGTALPTTGWEEFEADYAAGKYSR